MANKLTPIEEKELPIEMETNKEIPVKSKLIDQQPEETPVLTEAPEKSELKETTPEASENKTDMPSDFVEENCVVVNGQKIEIKPTKLKYFRNKAASAYGIIKVVPLHELLTYDKGVLDERRDADQLLYDFLVAAFDDPEFVKKNYDEFDADIIDRVAKIFGEVNHINEKEEAARKNREAQAAKH